jgi:integrase
MMVDSLPPLVTKEIDAICRKFLWVGNDVLVHSKCLVAWKTACRTTELGELGITDLKLVGYALQTRWLWLQKTDSSRKLPINADTQVRAFFCVSTYTELGDGANALF